jgi:hypothetical protein
MSQNALPTSVTIGASFSVSFLADRMCSGNLVRVQLKTVVRIAHQAGLLGTSQTTVPGFVAGGIRQSDVEVAVRFDFHSDDAARNGIPIVLAPGSL